MVTLRGWVTLLALVSASGMAVSVNILMLRVPEQELNRGVKHILDNHLLPHIKHEYKFEDVLYELGTKTRLHFENIKITKLDSVDTHVQLKPNNTVDLSAKIDILELSIDFTLDGAGSTDKYPKSLIRILGPALSLTVQIGTGPNGTDVTLKECKANFINLTSDDLELQKTLQGLLELGAKNSFAQLVEKVCPYLEEEAETVLVGILKIEETFEIKDAANQNVGIDLRVEYSETSTDLATIVTSVTKAGGPAPSVNPSDVSFPAGSGGRIEIWLDSPLLELLTDNAISEKVFSDTRYSATLAGNTYNVFAQLNSVTYDVALTPDGVTISTLANITLDHIGQVQNPCITMGVHLKAKVPMLITYNDAKIVISPDLDRLKIGFDVKSLSGKCSMPDDDQQEELVRFYSNHFQNSLKDKYIDIEVVKTKYFGFKEINVKLHTGCVVIESLLETDLSASPSLRTHAMYHKTATGKRITVIPRGGQEKVIEYKPLRKGTSKANARRDASLTLLLAMVLGALLL